MFHVFALLSSMSVLAAGNAVSSADVPTVAPSPCEHVSLTIPRAQLIALRDRAESASIDAYSQAEYATLRGNADAAIRWRAVSEREKGKAEAYSALLSAGNTRDGNKVLHSRYGAR